MRLIDADALIKNTIMNPSHVPYIAKDDVDNEPTIEQDWNEIMVICDNCGHIVHAKRENCKVSAQPKRKTGKWIYQSGLGWGETWICSECGEKTTSTIMGKPRYEWCPMCGADMRQGSNGNE